MIKKIAHLADIHFKKTPTRNEEYEGVIVDLVNKLRVDNPDRIVIVGDLVDDYLDLSGEQIIIAQKFLVDLAKIAPVRITRGNHDYRKKTQTRIDSVDAVVRICKNSGADIKYFNDSGFYLDDNVVWSVWHHGEINNNPWKSVEGKEVQKNRKKEIKYIDLYHDPINGCVADNGLELKTSVGYGINDFKGDYSFFGDIHKKQYFSNKTKAYSSSLLPQKYDEGDDNFHGYLLWDIIDNSVVERAVHNDYSFKNVIVNPYFDFDELDYEIPNPTKYMRVRFVWRTLPSQKNRVSENKLREYFKNKYPGIIKFNSKNEFIENEKIEKVERGKLENVLNPVVQKEIFKDYLNKIGLSEKEVNSILELDETINTMIDLKNELYLNWGVVKFGGVNFMSYENVDVDWRDMFGLFKIMGKNTAGKTTLLKLISYVLYGVTLETESQMKFGDQRFVNNRNGANYTENYVVLDINGEYYGIKRKTTIKRSKSGEINGTPTEVTFYSLNNPDDVMSDNNSVDNLDNDRKKHVQKLLDSVVGSYKNFKRIVITTSDTLNDTLSSNDSTFIDSILFDSGVDVFDKKLTAVKEYEKKINEKRRIVCDVDKVNGDNNTYDGEINELIKRLNEINDVKLIEVGASIDKGNEYLRGVMGKIHQIDVDIVGLNVSDSNKQIDELNISINNRLNRKKFLEDSLLQLSERYDSDRLEFLNGESEKIKRIINDFKYQIKLLESKIETESHNIEVFRGDIIKKQKTITDKENKIIEIKNSKNCYACGQLIDKKEHLEHISNVVSDIENEINQIKNDILEISGNKIPSTENKILEFKKNIITINESIDEKSTGYDKMLVEIGVINNQKNDVEKRNTINVELNNIPIKNENDNLKIELLNNKIQKYYDNLTKIRENEENNLIIKKAEDRLLFLNSEREKLLKERNDIESNIFIKRDKIKSNKELIREYNEQLERDLIISTYKKCVHRDGIPRQILSEMIIPQMNHHISELLDDAEYSVWLDPETFKPKLMYHSRPDSIIDCISSSGKERTFSSVAIKYALNQINIKSKPDIFLLDEVMGKLDEEGVVEFISILHKIKEKITKTLIIEHVHEMHPDYVISVTSNDSGISSAVIN